MYCEGKGKYSKLVRLLQYCFVPDEGYCKIEQFEPLRVAANAYYLIHDNQNSTVLLRHLFVDESKHPSLFEFCKILKQQNDDCFIQKSNHRLFLFDSRCEGAAIASIRLTALESYLDDVISGAFAVIDAAFKEVGLDLDVACDLELGERIANQSTDAIIAWANSHGIAKGCISLDVFALFFKLAMNS